MPQFDSDAAEQIGRFSEGLLLRLLQFDTLRLRLITIAARIVEIKTMIRVHLPTSCPGQDILRFGDEQ